MQHVKAPIARIAAVCNLKNDVQAMLAYRQQPILS
jgi:hypothetical protein